MPQDTPTHSPRAMATRQRILDAALVEFAAKGLAGARVDEIAARAAANKRMIYAHFGNKDDLWLTVLERAYAAKREQERALRVDSLPPAEAVRRLLEFNLRFTAAHPDLVSLLNQENIHRAERLRRSGRVPALYSPMLESLRAVLARGEAEGAFRRGVDPMQFYITMLALGHFHVANTYTLSIIFGAEPGAEEALRERERHCVEVALGYLRP